MKRFKYVLLFALILGCGSQTLIDEMLAEVPIYQKGKIVQKSELPAERMSIIQYEINATEATEDSLVSFYKDSMLPKGWELNELKQYAGDGSVFTFTKKEQATLTIQVISKGVRQSGKLKVVLNLTRLNA